MPKPPAGLENSVIGDKLAKVANPSLLPDCYARCDKCPDIEFCDQYYYRAQEGISYDKETHE